MEDETPLPDLEVARYALRSFQLQGDHLWPIAIADDSWKDGTCVARCIGGSMAGSNMPFLAVAGGSLYNTLYRTTSYISNDHSADHSAPYMGCSCGIYGTLSLEHLVDQYPAFSKSLVSVIAAEGPTILGPRGLRTSAARVVAFWSRNHAIVKAAGTQFKDAILYRSLVSMLGEYGLPVLNADREVS